MAIGFTALATITTTLTKEIPGQTNIPGRDLKKQNFSLNEKCDRAPLTFTVLYDIKINWNKFYDNLGGWVFTRAVDFGHCIVSLVLHHEVPDGLSVLHWNGGGGSVFGSRARLFSQPHVESERRILPELILLRDRVERRLWRIRPTGILFRVVQENHQNLKEFS